MSVIRLCFELASYLYQSALPKQGRIIIKDTSNQTNLKSELITYPSLINYINDTDKFSLVFASGDPGDAACLYKLFKSLQKKSNLKENYELLNL